MSVVRGALGPLLEKTIKEQLSYEHQVLDGKAERKQVSAQQIIQKHCHSKTVCLNVCSD